MKLSKRGTKMRVMAVMLFSCVAMMVAQDASAEDGATCRVVRGRFDSRAVSPAECNSPVGFCTSGTLTGGIVGNYSFTMMTASPAGDPTVPGMTFYTGVSLMELGDAKGTLVATDTGTVDLFPFGTGRMAAILTITDGADGMEGARGHLVLRGRMNVLTGRVEGDYEGELCMP